MGSLLPHRLAVGSGRRCAGVIFFDAAEIGVKFVDAGAGTGRRRFRCPAIGADLRLRRSSGSLLAGSSKSAAGGARVLEVGLAL
jgi:hypothetical protein